MHATQPARCRLAAVAIAIFKPGHGIGFGSDVGADIGIEIECAQLAAEEMVVGTVGRAQGDFGLPPREIAQFRANLDCQLDLRMAGAKASHGGHVEPGQDINRGELDVAGQAMVAPGDVAFKSRQFRFDAPGAFQQALAFRREDDTIVTAIGEAGAKMRLKLLEFSRDGGVGNAQQSRGAREAAGTFKRCDDAKVGWLH